VTGAGNYRFEGEENGAHADRFWSAAMMIEAASSPAGAVSAADVHSAAHVRAPEAMRSGSRESTFNNAAEFLQRVREQHAALSP